MKKKVVIVIILIVTVIMVTPVRDYAYLYTMIWVGHNEYTKRTHVENFDDHKKDFEVIAKLVYEKGKNKMNKHDDYYIISKDHKNNSPVRITDVKTFERLELSDDEQNSLENIYNYTEIFNTILIRSNAVYFCASCEYDAFELVYSLNGISPGSTMYGRSIFIHKENLGDGWYSYTGTR